MDETLTMPKCPPACSERPPRFSSIAGPDEEAAIVGRTPLRLFDVQKVEPCLLSPGDEVVFRRIGEQEFTEIASQVGTL